MRPQRKLGNLPRTSDPEGLLASGPQPGPRLSFRSSRSWPACWPAPSTNPGAPEQASSSNPHEGFLRPCVHKEVASRPSRSGTLREVGA